MKILIIIFGTLLPLGLSAQSAFVLSRYYQQSNRLEMVWAATELQYRVDSIVVYRATKTDPDFKPIATNLSYENRKDTMYYTLADSAVQRYEVYNYYLSVRYAGQDSFSNTDTVFVAALDFLEMPMPDHITALPGAGGRGIHISWQLKHAALVKQLTLYRSSNSVDGFEVVATLPLDRMEYTDYTVHPATPYFYYFALEYKTQNLAKRGPSFAASFTDSEPPPAVVDVEAEGTEDGVRLSWNNSGEHTAGFWLYRGVNDGPLQLVSAFIPAIDSLRHYDFVDTDSLLSGAKEYAYAIKSYSTSHIESNFSDTVLARPLKNIPVPKAPLNVTAIADEADIFVSWDDVAAADEWVAGYTILRKKLPVGETGRQALPDTLFSTVNFYVDSLIKPGESYEYSVLSNSMLGVRSAASIAVSSGLGVVKPAAPGTLLATAAKNGVLLQWELPQGGEAFHYNIYRFVRGQEAVKMASTKVGADTYTDSTAVKGTEYFYSVRTVNAEGLESNKSNESRAVY